MAVELSEKQIGELSDRVKKLLDQECQKRRIGFSLNVVEPFVQEDILCLVVVPDKEGMRASDHADILTKVETVLRKEGTNVLLVPARSD